MPLKGRSVPVYYEITQCSFSFQYYVFCCRYICNMRHTVLALSKDFLVHISTIWTPKYFHYCRRYCCFRRRWQHKYRATPISVAIISVSACILASTICSTLKTSTALLLASATESHILRANARRHPLSLGRQVPDQHIERLMQNNAFTTTILILAVVKIVPVVTSIPKPAWPKYANVCLAARTPLINRVTFASFRLSPRSLLLSFSFKLSFMSVRRMAIWFYGRIAFGLCINKITRRNSSVRSTDWSLNAREKA